MENQKRDLDGLVETLNLWKKGGYTNPGIANNRIRIAKDVLSTVPDVGNDLTKIDADEVYSRYAMLKSSSLLPATLQGNKAHFKSAIAEFSSFVEDPLNYKPKAVKSKKDQSL
ncbi:MAG TPA: hypothetical protein VJK47_03065, partial [Dehalococcoidales bacterium]|nr:hypothetical protein [Dehalococcoidales bacterium]